MPGERNEGDIFGGSGGDKPVESAAGDAGNKVEQQAKAKAGEDTDISEHPEFKALKAKNEELGTNLSEQGKVLDKYTKEQRKALETAAIDPSKLPWKAEELKTSKELTDAERDDMTEGEMKKHDELVAMKKRENERAEKEARAEMVKETEKEVADATKVKGDDLKTLVASEIGALSGGDAEKKRELEEAVGMLNLSGLTTEQVKERVKAAQKLVPSYVPPKEQAGAAGGKAVKEGNGGDPFGTDAIIKEARGGNAGTYAL